MQFADGVPTVADRIAQEVARRYLEPIVEPVFHADSYGYRPGKSAVDAVHRARQRCWRYDWVLDLDIKGFFDSIDWELLLRAIRHHTDCPWVLLYIERWLKAPASIAGRKLRLVNLVQDSAAPFVIGDGMIRRSSRGVIKHDIGGPDSNQHLRSRTRRVS